jgi:hypothetical protein
MLERRNDVVQQVDPGYKSLNSVLLAVQTYASWLGVDMGVRPGGVVAAGLMNGAANRRARRTIQRKMWRGR